MSPAAAAVQPLPNRVHSASGASWATASTQRHDWETPQVTQAGGVPHCGSRRWCEACWCSEPGRRSGNPEPYHSWPHSAQSTNPALRAGAGIRSNVGRPLSVLAPHGSAGHRCLPCVAKGYNPPAGQNRAGRAPPGPPARVKMPAYGPSAATAVPQGCRGSRRWPARLFVRSQLPYVCCRYSRMAEDSNMATPVLGSSR